MVKSNQEEKDMKKSVRQNSNLAKYEKKKKKKS